MKSIQRKDFKGNIRSIHASTFNNRKIKSIKIDLRLAQYWIIPGVKTPGFYKEYLTTANPQTLIIFQYQLKNLHLLHI